MKTQIGAMVAAGTLTLAAFAAPVAAAGKNDPTTSCGVGSLVSLSAQAVWDVYGMNLGQYTKVYYDGTMGEAVQEAHGFVTGCP